MNINSIILNSDLIAATGIFLLAAGIGIASIVKPFRISNPLIRTFALLMTISAFIFLIINKILDLGNFHTISLLILYLVFNVIIVLILHKNSNLTFELFESFKFIKKKNRIQNGLIIILSIFFVKLILSIISFIFSDLMNPGNSNLYYLIIIIIPELIILSYFIFKKEQEIMIFYIFNSVMFNNLFLSAFSSNFTVINHTPVDYSNGLMLLISTLVFYPLTKSGNTIGRKEGLILIFFCAVYLIFLMK